MSPGGRKPIGGPSSGHEEKGAVAMSVAVCAYTDRRWNLLVEAVERTEKQLMDGDELLLVIDHSPELYERVRAQFPALNVVANHHGKGLSGARNTAIDTASGDVIVFLDDDASPDPGWLEALRESYSARQILGVGGIVTPCWDSLSPAWMPAEFLWVVGCSYEGLPRSVAPIRNPIGANMSFRREVFTQVGGFSEALGRVGTLPVGCEETELSMRVSARYGDGVIIHQPAASVTHHVTHERTSFGYYLRRCWSEGLSKAIVSQLAERRGGLRTERGYVTDTVLPAVGRQLLRGVRGYSDAWSKTAALLIGTAVTVTSYLVHSLAGGRR